MRSFRLPAGDRARAALVGVLALLGVLLVNQVLESSHGGGRGTPAALDFLGIIQGLSTALLAVALVLVYRIHRIINFSTLAFGIPSALIGFETLYYSGAPLPIVVLLSVAAGAALGAITELAVGRRFAQRSRLQFTILTIAISSVVAQQGIGVARKAPWLPNAKTRSDVDLLNPNSLFPHLPLPGFHFHIGSYPVQFRFGHVFAIELALGTLLVLALLLRFTRLGVALRSVAQNTERAGLLGIDTGSIGTFAWALAGALAAVAVLIQGFAGTTAVALGNGSTSTLGLVTALTAAVLARFRSLPAAVGWSVALEVLKVGVVYGHANPAPLTYGAELVLLVVGLLSLRKELDRLAEGRAGSWRLAAEQRRIPPQLASLGIVRATRVVAVLLLLAAGGFLPFVLSAGTTSTLAQTFLFGLVGLSLVILTGWNGQVSLGQYAFAAIGAVVAGGAAERGHVPFLIAVPVAVLVCAGVAVLVGLPALRVKGLLLGVVTFALVPAVTSILFDQDLFGWLIPEQITRPTLFGFSFNSEKSFYFLALAVLLMTIVLVSNMRRTRLGRILIAARDNEGALQATGVSVVTAKILGFAVAGGLAGLAGALLGFQLRGVQPGTFGAGLSLQFFYYVVLGGVSSVPGALMGVGLLTIVGQQTGAIFTAVAPLVVLGLLYLFPGGLMELFTSLRDSVLRIVAQRSQIIVPDLFEDYDPDSVSRNLIPLGAPALSSGLAALPRSLRYRKASRVHGKVLVDAGVGGREEHVLTAASQGLLDFDEPSTQEEPVTL
ncbi:MAG: ABC-type branched-chain amino acid transport system, permease component [Frankiales bacterium]|nr:ABC-type branched-chain amino acid transport system, permease component [Frankiales bacterium]